MEGPSVVIRKKNYPVVTHCDDSISGRSRRQHCLFPRSVDMLCWLDLELRLILARSRGRCDRDNDSDQKGYFYDIAEHSHSPLNDSSRPARERAVDAGTSALARRPRQGEPSSP